MDMQVTDILKSLRRSFVKSYCAVLGLSHLIKENPNLKYEGSKFLSEGFYLTFCK